jgi:hypothetical protein
MLNGKLNPHEGASIMTTTNASGSPRLSHDYLSPDEVADKLPGITKGTLATWRYEHKGPPYRKLGRFVVYPVDELDEWIEASVSDGRPVGR